MSYLWLQVRVGPRLQRLQGLLSAETAPECLHGAPGQPNLPPVSARVENRQEEGVYGPGVSTP